MKLRKLQKASLMSAVYWLFKTWNFVKIFFFIFPSYTSFRGAPLVQQMCYLARKDDMEEKLKGKEKKKGKGRRGRFQNILLQWVGSTLLAQEFPPKRQRVQGHQSGNPYPLSHSHIWQAGLVVGGRISETSWASISEKKKVMHPKRPPAKAILWVKCRLPTPAPPGETPPSYTKHACGMTPCGMFSSRWRWENKGRLKAQGGQSRSPAEYRARGAQVPLRPESGLEEMLGSNASARPHGGVSQRRFPSTRSRSPLEELCDFFLSLF